ncbi:EAL domain-containing protein [Sphingosinithalassobacter sp. LHW66-3]|uniref:EAL domain-containing protein n=1 Tax=Sphingosinithalassobacter sp. LHW66-3 TaxID=3424718 RepID=UPI003D6A2E1B
MLDRLARPDLVFAADVVTFQPIVDAETAQPFAYQALTRRPVADPAAAVAVLRSAVAAGLAESGALLAIPLALDAPARTLLAALLREAFAQRLPAHRLVILVSADEYGAPGAAARLVGACGEQGLAVAFTDFSAGPVGVQLLARHTPHFVALDPALVRNLETSAARRLVVAGVLRLARRTGAPLVAPAIRTAAELATLHGLGLRLVQGDWIAPASATLTMPRSAAEADIVQAPLRRRHAVLARRELPATHRRLQHHQRPARAPAQLAVAEELAILA